MNVEKLREDLGIALRFSEFLEDCPGCNFRIINPKYLNPSIGFEVLPINHPQGSSMYFKKIIEALEIALIYNTVPKEKLPINSPRYLEEMAR